jgi:PAS domain S-box-containing protein
MDKTDGIIRDLKDENAELRSQLVECQETLQAIQAGEVDALVVQSPSGDRIYTLKDAEHPYRVMVETMTEGAATMAADGTVFYCNQQLSTLLKVPLNRIMGASMVNYVAPSDLTAFQSILSNAKNGTGRAEIELRNTEGIAIPVLVSAKTSIGESGKVISLVVTDLSEHNRTEQIITSERFTRTLLEQAADAIVVCNSEGTVIRASAKALKIIGIGMLGWHFDRAFEQFYIVPTAGEPDIPGSRRMHLSIAALVQGKVPEKGEVELIIKGRIKQSFILNFSPLKEENNITGYSISLTDITERKKAEEELKDSEERLRSVLDKSRDVIVRFNLQAGCYEYVSSSIKALIGYSPEEFADMDGQTALTMVHPDDLTILQTARAQALETGQAEAEYRQRHKNGDWVWVSNLMLVVKDSTGRPLFRSSNIRDITESKRGEDELKHYSAELEAANKELEAFSYSVSHDLKAPLRSLDSFSRAILQDYGDKLDTQGKDYLDRIISASKLMSDLIEDILSLYKVTQAPLNRGEANLSELANDVEAELRRVYPESNAEFKITPDLKADGDRNLLKLALDNLMGNAFKFTRKVSQPVIEFGMKKENGLSVYFVRDNGVGFNMAHADKLFKPFQRLHSAKDFPGTGIGLASVQRIIHRHGGKVWANGKPGQGATFYFTLSE